MLSYTVLPCAHQAFRHCEVTYKIGNRNLWLCIFSCAPACTEMAVTLQRVPKDAPARDNACKGMCTGVQ